ncbi:TRAP transporter, DctM subunit [Alteribacillus persepolensis]|uniref:TRAP transporter, DctM subunit n=1 Tax=Alteribacillus persepolensis TaxID=568899 RepID=A0A1G8J755_9BACI|nr:TRAP transporter large permease [Alteribacillus persepolensis]SDI27099.1 TRAP transporter, DctM subunit [Alteribacillus persepolensis]
MDPSMIAAAGLVVMFLMMFISVPISVAMFITGMGGLFVMSSSTSAFYLLSSEVWNSFSSYSLSVIPLYILMGEIVFQSGLTARLFNAAYRWFGHLRGGMAGTTILASAGFASICGSNAAAAASMGTMALPELKKYKYNPALSTGSVATGGTLGIIIPPSTVLIVIAIQTQQSIRDLFIASIIPGILLVIFFLLTILYLCHRNPEYGPPGPKFSFKEKMRAVYGVVPILGLFLFVIGGLFLGWFTPSESAAFGALGAILLTLAMKRLTKEGFVTAVKNTIKTSAMVLMLIVGATYLGRFLAVTRLPNEVAEWISSLPVHSLVIVFAILTVYVIGGSLMDAMGFLMVSIPIFYPPVIAIGYDPVWFAILLCIVTSLGAITPPVGVNAFVVQGLTPSTNITTIFKGTSYFLVNYVIFIIILVVFPQIILFLV